MQGPVNTQAATLQNYHVVTIKKTAIFLIVTPIFCPDTAKTGLLESYDQKISEFLDRNLIRAESCTLKLLYLGTVLPKNHVKQRFCIHLYLL